jgi:protein-L-isoaspartate(D-aspartate) O-methyltransferase
VQRQNMVESQVRPNGITDARVIDAMAMAAVPRELFVPEERRTLAYMDEDVLVAVTPDGSRRWLMEPMTFARLLQLAEIGPARSCSISAAPPATPPR